MSASSDVIGHPASQRHNVSAVLLLFGLIAAPLAWIVQTSLNYVVASRACYPFQTRQLQTATDGLWPVLIIATVVALVIGIAAACTAWQAWRRTREEHYGGGHHVMNVAEGRTRFLALAGLLISGLFAGAVIFNAVGLVLISPCG